MRDLVTRVERVDWADDATERRDGVEGDAILGTVWTQNAEHVAFLETTLSQVMRDDRYRVSELLVGECPACWTIDQGRFIGQFGGTVHHERCQGSFWNVYVRIGTFKYHLWFLGE